MAAFFRRGSLRLAVAAVVVAVGLLLVAFLFVPGRGGSASDPVAALSPSESGGGDGGSWEGRVVLTEFADFNCGYCARFHFAYAAGLRSEFSGVEFRFRHFPFLSGSSWSAALAYECAAAEGHGEDYHDLLFERHLAEGGPTLVPAPWPVTPGRWAWTRPLSDGV